MNKRKAFTISRENWKLLDRYEYEGFSGRPACDVAVGTAEEKGAEVYVTEPFFEDILPMVFAKSATVHLDLYSEPKAVLEKEGKLILHNGDVMDLKKNVLTVLSDIYVSNQLRAAAEIRANRYSSCKIGNTTKVIKAIIKESLGINVNYDFLKLLLREKFLVHQVGEDPLEHIVGRYAKEDLVYLYGCILEYKRTGGSRFDPLKTLLAEGYVVDEIERKLQQEVAFRFFSGSIH